MANVRLARLRKALPGKIIGFQYNNIRFGDEIAPPKLSASKADASTQANVPAYLYLSQRDWTATPNAYAALPDAPPGGSNWFSTPYTLTANSIPDVTSLMKFLLDYAQDTGAAPASHITNVETLGGGSDPSDDPEWLEALTFYSKEYRNEDGYYELEYDEDDNLIGGTWTGASWMYYIGSPAAPDTSYSGSHGSAYPDLRLDEFTVGNLPNNAFTLTWDTTSFSFEVRTSKEGGELVHRASRRLA